MCVIWWKLTECCSKYRHCITRIDQYTLYGARAFDRIQIQRKQLIRLRKWQNEMQTNTRTSLALAKNLKNRHRRRGPGSSSINENISDFTEYGKQFDDCNLQSKDDRLSSFNIFYSVSRQLQSHRGIIFDRRNEGRGRRIVKERERDREKKYFSEKLCRPWMMNSYNDHISRECTKCTEKKRPQEECGTMKKKEKRNK